MPSCVGNSTITTQSSANVQLTLPRMDFSAYVGQSNAYMLYMRMLKLPTQRNETETKLFCFLAKQNTKTAVKRF